MRHRAKQLLSLRAEVLTAEVQQDGSCQPAVSLWTAQHTDFCVRLKQVLGRKLLHSGRWDGGRDFLKWDWEKLLSIEASNRK